MEMASEATTMALAKLTASPAATSSPRPGKLLSLPLSSQKKKKETSSSPAGTPCKSGNDNGTPTTIDGAVFEIKTRRDQGNSTASPVKVCKQIHSTEKKGSSLKTLPVSQNSTPASRQGSNGFKFFSLPKKKSSEFFEIKPEGRHNKSFPSTDCGESQLPSQHAPIGHERRFSQSAHPSTSSHASTSVESPFRITSDVLRMHSGQTSRGQTDLNTRHSLPESSRDQLRMMTLNFPDNDQYVTLAEARKSTPVRAEVKQTNGESAKTKHEDTFEKQESKLKMDDGNRESKAKPDGKGSDKKMKKDREKSKEREKKADFGSSKWVHCHKCGQCYRKISEHTAVINNGRREVREKSDKKKNNKEKSHICQNEKGESTCKTHNYGNIDLFPTQETPGGSSEKCLPQKHHISPNDRQSKPQRTDALATTGRFEVLDVSDCLKPCADAILHYENSGRNAMTSSCPPSLAQSVFKSANVREKLESNLRNASTETPRNSAMTVRLIGMNRKGSSSTSGSVGQGDNIHTCHVTRSSTDDQLQTSGKLIVSDKSTWSRSSDTSAYTVTCNGLAMFASSCKRENGCHSQKQDNACSDMFARHKKNGQSSSTSKMTPVPQLVVSNRTQPHNTKGEMTKSYSPSEAHSKVSQCSQDGTPPDKQHTSTPDGSPSVTSGATLTPEVSPVLDSDLSIRREDKEYFHHKYRLYFDDDSKDSSSPGSRGDPMEDHPGMPPLCVNPTSAPSSLSVAEHILAFDSSEHLKLAVEQRSPRASSTFCHMMPILSPSSAPSSQHGDSCRLSHSTTIPFTPSSSLSQCVGSNTRQVPQAKCNSSLSSETFSCAAGASTCPVPQSDSSASGKSWFKKRDDSSRPSQSHLQNKTKAASSCTGQSVDNSPFLDYTPQRRSVQEDFTNQRLVQSVPSLSGMLTPSDSGPAATSYNPSLHQIAPDNLTMDIHTSSSSGASTLTRLSNKSLSGTGYVSRSKDMNCSSSSSSCTTSKRTQTNPDFAVINIPPRSSNGNLATSKASEGISSQLCAASLNRPALRNGFLIHPAFLSPPSSKGERKSLPPQFESSLSQTISSSNGIFSILPYNEYVIRDIRPDVDEGQNGGQHETFTPNGMSTLPHSSGVHKSKEQRNAVLSPKEDPCSDLNQSKSFPVSLTNCDQRPSSACNGHSGSLQFVSGDHRHRASPHHNMRMGSTFMTLKQRQSQELEARATCHPWRHSVDSAQPFPHSNGEFSSMLPRTNDAFYPAKSKYPQCRAGSSSSSSSLDKRISPHPPKPNLNNNEPAPSMTQSWNGPILGAHVRPKTRPKSTHHDIVAHAQLSSSASSRRSTPEVVNHVPCQRPVRRDHQEKPKSRDANSPQERENPRDSNSPHFREMPQPCPMSYDASPDLLPRHDSLPKDGERNSNGKHGGHATSTKRSIFSKLALAPLAFFSREPKPDCSK